MPPAEPSQIGPRTHERVPYLDGLRAVAIAGVLYDHALLSPGWASSVRASFPGPYVCGNLGVHLFFVISGFIITHLLIKEEQRTGRVSLRQFWSRRAVRILPPLVVFLGFVFAAGLLDTRLKSPAIEFLTALTFTKFILSDFQSWWLGHTWSLSIEEQFYLVWPLAFLFRGRKRVVFTMTLIAGIVLASLWLFHRSYDRWGWLLPAQAGYLVAGCLLASLRDRGFLRLPAGRGATILGLLIAATAVGLTHSAVMENRTWGIFVPLNSFLGGLGLALLVEMLLEGRFPAAGWILERPAVKWLGWISYSLYLWQQVLLGPDGFSWMQRFPQNLPFAVALAAVSYYAIEVPCREAYRRFSRAAA